MKTTQSEMHFTVPQNDRVPAVALRTLTVVAAGMAVLTSLTSPLQAAPINVPNGSFELQSGVGQPFGVNINIDSWQKAPKPAYFDEVAYGFAWVQTAGVFVDSNPYGNRDGTQAAYLLSFPQVTLFQDLTAPDANFEVGTSYSFTLGIFGKGMADGATLALSFFYRDNLNNMVTVGTPTTVTYSTAAFPSTPPLNLFDYSVNIPYVQTGDSWVGKDIGLKIESTFGTGGGNWDMDNARLIATPVPEPATLSLLALGIGGWLFVRGRNRGV